MPKSGLTILMLYTCDFQEHITVLWLPHRHLLAAIESSFQPSHKTSYRHPNKTPSPLSRKKTSPAPPPSEKYPQKGRLLRSSARLGGGGWRKGTITSTGFFETLAYPYHFFKQNVRTEHLFAYLSKYTR